MGHDINLNINLSAAGLASLLQSGIDLLSTLQRDITHMSAELDDLKTSVAANTDTIASAVELIQGIAARIDAAGVDPQALADLSASLKADDAALAAAVAANQPAPAPATP